jgi:GTP cyclohydrolase I
VTIDDVQSHHDPRGVAIDRVGVAGLRCPIVVLDREQGRQQTVAELTMSVNLSPHFKGTHMSRFIEALNEHRGEVTMRTLPALLAALRERLDAERAHIAVEFPYFVDRTAPESGARALMDYACAFRAETSDEGDDFVLSVRVPVTSVCPCSKAISDYGAHNQRGYVTIEVRTVRADDGRPELVWIEELIDLAEQSASAPVYPLVKRVDERRLTMQAYDNPVFVEDIVRNAAERLDKDPRVAWFRVHARNDESIHNHSVFAQIERDLTSARQTGDLAEHATVPIDARAGSA